MLCEIMAVKQLMIASKKIVYIMFIFIMYM